MTTLDLELAIMRFFDYRMNIIVPNLSWGMLKYEADIVVLSWSNYASEIEIKISKADFKADFKKQHYHNSEYFKYFYYAVPAEMQDFALENLPEGAGLIVVSVRKGTPVASIVKKAICKKHKQWTHGERMKLAELGCMRIYALKNKISKGQRSQHERND